MGGSVNTLDIRAIIDHERSQMISKRTKAGLAVAKARGVKLGNPQNLTKNARTLGRKASAIVRKTAQRKWLDDVATVVRKIHQQGLSLRETANLLNQQDIPARRGGKWSAAQVYRVVKAE